MNEGALASDSVVLMQKHEDIYIYIFLIFMGKSYIELN